MRNFLHPQLINKYCWSLEKYILTGKLLQHTNNFFKFIELHCKSLTQA